jgi:hypothetical protein
MSLHFVKEHEVSILEMCWCCSFVIITASFVTKDSLIVIWLAPKDKLFLMPCMSLIFAIEVNEKSAHAVTQPAQPRFATSIFCPSFYSLHSPSTHLLHTWPACSAPYVAPYPRRYCDAVASSYPLGATVVDK